MERHQLLATGCKAKKAHPFSLIRHSRNLARLTVSLLDLTIRQRKSSTVWRW